MQRFVRWLKTTVLPKLRNDAVLVMDNLAVHRDPRIAAACANRGVQLVSSPPYSPDRNPIEPGWALQKQYVRRYAPRHADALGRIARRARFRVAPRACRGWFGRTGDSVQFR
jgi:transposase